MNDRTLSLDRSTLPCGVSPLSSDANASRWFRIGYLLIGLLLLARLIFVAGSTIELSEDEAYQWLWSKHPALSYFSKPPLIAYTQWLGRSLWGDTAFGVRFFSPVIAAGLSLLMFRFMAREVSARAGVWLLVIIASTPLMMVGAVLMTIDSVSVLFWTAAMVSGWQSVRSDSMKSWCWTGLWVGMAFLAKYMLPFHLLSWVVFFALWKPARPLLRRPGPYVASFIAMVCTIPVLVWNQQHDWITLTHLKDRGGLDEVWVFTCRFLAEFTLAEIGLLNPVFFLGMLLAAVAAWKQRRDGLSVFCFSMGVPMFLFYWIYTLRARVQPNWIEPTLLPLACVMVIHWENRLKEGWNGWRRWLTSGLAFGLLVGPPLHNTGIITTVTGIAVPPASDPKRRVSGWSQTAELVEKEFRGVQSDGVPAFVIGSHYGITSLLSFYWPEARLRVLEDPLVYYRSSDVPMNQFYFWKGYSDRKGQNALFVARADRPAPPPERLVSEFESVTDLGMREISVNGRVLHRLQLFKCAGLR